MPKFANDLIKALWSARHLAVLTGAGISAESGVPTFRDAQTGLWSQYRPEDLATSEAFRRDPKLVSEWYAWRREIVTQAQPNPGHYALVKIEASLAQFEARFTLITQNVDSLHRRAGSQCVVELHGSLQRVKCEREGQVFLTEQIPDRMMEIPPHCPGCGGLLRPDVVWFGESLPVDALETAWAAAEDCDVFLTVGTSALVQPAASLPIVARQHGALVIEINSDTTLLTSQVDYSFRGPSGALLPELVRAVWHI
jgi:NAD-dependent deacetylase